MSDSAGDGQHVVLVDDDGRPCGTAPKSTVHGPQTPLHLAFSCHVVRHDGAVLLSRRASSKLTWPGVWSNACCGHPQFGETIHQAVSRRLGQELGLRPRRLTVEVPDFAYRAEMADGTVEHELCPVVVAEVDDLPVPDPEEIDEVRWVAWAELCRRADTDPASLSPWSVLQLRELVASGFSPQAWLRGADPVAGARPTDRRFDEPGSADWVYGPVTRPVSAVLRDHLRCTSVSTEAIDSRLSDVTAELDGLVAAGGKRLRPAFVYWGHRATGAGHSDDVIAAAAAVELLHTFALLHDDVMDRSADRRGRPTAHRTLAARHVERQWSGDPSWFGISAAVLAGDLAFVGADELIDSIQMSPDAVRRARRVFNELRREVMAGQYLDLVVAADPSSDEHAARRVALLKSARYTVTRPLLLGSALGDEAAGRAVQEALTSYGDAIGLAFQLRDDVLGVFGDPALTGKSTLDDLRGGKRTVLMLRAIRLSSPAQRRELLCALGDPDLDDVRAERVRRIVAASGALASVEALITAQHSRGVRSLEAIPEPARSALRCLADGAVRRRS